MTRVEEQQQQQQQRKWEALSVVAARNSLARTVVATGLRLRRDSARSARIKLRSRPALRFSPLYMCAVGVSCPRRAPTLSA